MNICFITNELHPFAPGGIGRLMYNFAVQNRDRKTNRRNFYFLISSLDLPNYEMLAEYFEEHDLGTVIATPTEFSYLGEQESRLFHCIPNEYSGPSFVRKSIEYYNGLLYLEARYGIQLDLIEFPDYGGLGFATLAAKHAGLAFRNTMITVRLHSTGGIIHDAEPFYHRKGKGELSFFELERQCLEQAELVVSHLPVITTANQNFYSFKSTWQKKVIHEFPPIFLEGDEIFDSKADEATRDFIFSSRLQPFKRPDLFIKAAVIFLDCNPIYEGRFYVVSYGWDKAYINWLQNLVPKQYKDCIHFIFNAEASLRNKLLQNSIVVIPSNYESLCLFAYESALRGNKLILNRQCLAFGEAPYWQEGENCLKFDGTADDLARAYERALISPQPTPKPLPESLCYWHQEKKNQGNQTKT
jgi:glycosyltransferase involved in cell wall biosynthesis